MDRDTILLVCDECGKKQEVSREASDYPEAVEMHIVCPDCDDGDFHEAAYFDAEGNHIIRDPDV